MRRCSSSEEDEEENRGWGKSSNSRSVGKTADDPETLHFLPGGGSPASPDPDNVNVGRSDGGGDVSLREWLDRERRCLDLPECLHIFKQIVEMICHFFSPHFKMKLQAPSLTSFHQTIDVSRSLSFSHSSTHRPTTTLSRFLQQRHQCYHHPQPSRRNLLIGSGSSTLPLLISTYFQTTTTTTDAQAATEVEESKEINTSNEKNCENQITAEKVYFDVSIDREPIGRIIVGLYGEDSTTTTVGAARFAGLASGKAGVSYRRKEFVKIMPNYIQHGGIRSFGVDTELAKQSGQADQKCGRIGGDYCQKSIKT